jgi:hypothetical protein
VDVGLADVGAEVGFVVVGFEASFEVGFEVVGVEVGLMMTGK